MLGTGTLSAFLHVILDLWGVGVGLDDISVVNYTGDSIGSNVVLSGMALQDSVVGGVAMVGVTLHCGQRNGTLKCSTVLHIIDLNSAVCITPSLTTSPRPTYKIWDVKINDRSPK